MGVTHLRAITRRAVITSAVALLTSLACTAATANVINKLVGTYLLLYNPDDPTKSSEYVRMSLGNGTQKDLDSFVKNKTTCTILRPTGNILNPFLAIPVGAKPRLNGGQLFLDCRLAPAGATFGPGDLVMVEITIEPKDAQGKLVTEAKFKPTAVQWRDGDGGVGAQTNNGKAKITGFKFKVDPDYFESNDLDSSVYSPAFGMDVKNLAFGDNVPESTFDIPDETATVKAVFDASLNNFLLTASLPSPGTEQPFLNAFTEPSFGLYAMAQGQIFDSNTGQKVGAFVQGVSTVPEAGTPVVMLLGFGTGAAFAARASRRRR